jgi:hypothetical protein
MGPRAEIGSDRLAGILAFRIHPAAVRCRSIPEQADGGGLEQELQQDASIAADADLVGPLSRRMMFMMPTALTNSEMLVTSSPTRSTTP